MSLPADCEIVDCNVLVLGGGFAGAWAALRAAELTDGVVLVDKAFVSRSGASPLSGGVTNCPLDGDDLDAWAEEFVVRGEYLCDQDWTMQLLQGQRERVQDYVRWNVPIVREPDGQIRRFKSRGMNIVRAMQYSPRAAMEELRRRVLGLGARILDRVCITELITSDGMWPTENGIVGAVGFHTRTGRFHVFRAKRTILSSGYVGTKGKKTDNNTGDGAAMALRAGARLVDMEFSFGGSFNLIMKQYWLGNYNVAVAQGARLLNARGERFMQKLDPDRAERSELTFIIAAFVKEIIDGRGPVYIDLTGCSAEYWKGVSALRGSKILLSGALPDPRVNPIPIEPTFGLGEYGRSGLSIDLRCRTNLPGLFAAGTAAKNDATGSHSSAGIPTAFCYNTGWWAGDTAARESRDTAAPSLPEAEIRRLQGKLFAPLSRRCGVTADELHTRLADSGSLVERMVLNENRLQRLIDTAREVAADAASAGARDLHDLVKLREARNLGECAEICYAAALRRTESRDQHYREDYPETDDDQWFCWHGVRRDRSGAQFDRTPIPIEKWRFRPKHKQKGLSPIAALMQGVFDPRFHFGDRLE